jgi:uncharacterized membrane protein
LVPPRLTHQILHDRKRKKSWRSRSGIGREGRRVKLRLSYAGLFLGAFFFAFSLTPSLLPRPLFVQGLLSGLSFGVGYGIGVALVALWTYLQLPLLHGRLRIGVKLVVAALIGTVLVSFLWQALEWQNALRALMGMEPSPGVHRLATGLIAAITFGLLLIIARAFSVIFRRVSDGFDRILPERIARVLGGLAALALFWSIVDGLLVASVLRVADRSFQQLDALIEDDLPRPERPDQAGSAASLVDWTDLGRQGRRFVAGGPDAEDLSEFFGAPMKAPIRVYVGLNTAATAAERARIAVDELERVGGFDRSVLLLVTPTGTGWVDAVGQDTVEYLHRGDIATVAAQYSYLNSPLSLLTKASDGTEMARAMFREVYGRWRDLAPESRPSLYLNGLSLGSLNSDLSFDLYDIIDEPFGGALWVGPPFSHASWARSTAQRDPGSPAWLPVFRGGAVVRFMNQDGSAAIANRDWGNFRIVFLQYASDPITFFSSDAAWREPEWMQAPRGPDVSPDLRWFPIVTMLQLAADMMVGATPRGFGHEYAADDYIDAWIALTRPEGWSEAELARLRLHFEP